MHFFPKKRSVDVVHHRVQHACGFILQRLCKVKQTRKEMKKMLDGERELIFFYFLASLAFLAAGFAD